jgi:predicted Zn-dependent protease
MPMARAAIEMHRNNPAGAVQLLQMASRGETGIVASLWPAYVRGLAYLSQGAGNEAIGEFQRILDHRGVLALAPDDFTPVGYSLYPLAHLGLARAAAIAGDAARSRKAYEEFFALWKDAESDIPILSRAKKEYQTITRSY